jgi:hypothetical protein
VRSEARDDGAFQRMYFQDGLIQNMVDSQNKSMSLYTYALEALAHVDLRARGHLHACQVARYMENFPGFGPEMAHPVLHAALGTGALSVTCIALTMGMLRWKDKKIG